MQQSLLIYVFGLIFIDKASCSAIDKPPQIVKDLRDVLLKPGSINRFVLECRGVGEPSPTYTWYKDGVELDESKLKGVNLMSDGDHSQLDFSNPAPEHEGYYYCEANNSLGRARSSVSHVTPKFFKAPENSIPPKFVKAPKTKIQTLGTRVEVFCEAEGTPQPVVQWMKNGKDILGETGNSFVINDLKESDVGNYACNASNTAGHIYKNVIVNILTVSAKIQEGPPETVIVSKGSNVSLICEAEGYPSPSIKWTKDGEDIQESGIEKYHINKKTGELTVLKANIEDQGKYECTAANHGIDTVNTELEVKDKTTILKGPEDKTVLVLTPLLEIPCQVVADLSLDLSVHWKKNNIDLGQPGFPLDKRIYKAENHSLLLHNLTFDDSGTYTCVAGTEASDTMTDSGFLTIGGIRPEVTVIPDKTGDRLEGEKVVLKCELAQLTLPEPKMFWYKDEEVISPDIATVDGDHSLTIMNAKVNHSGRYLCTAQNSEGSSRQTHHLAVRSHSVIKGSGVEIELKDENQIILGCNVEVDPELRHSMIVEWWKDGQSLKINSNNDQQVRYPSETITVEVEQEETSCQDGNNSNSSRYQILINSSLRICSPNSSDVGTYHCQISTDLEPLVLGPDNSIFLIYSFPWWIIVLVAVIVLLLLLICCLIWKCKKQNVGKGYYGMDVEGKHNKSDIYYTTEDADSIMQETDASIREGLNSQMAIKASKKSDEADEDAKAPIFTPKTIKHLSNVERSTGSLGSLLEDDAFLDKGMDEDGSFRERYAE